MLTAERKQKLLDVLKTEGKVLASDLSRRFGVSEDTVRRDLRELDRSGLLQRVHGGALPRTPSSIEHGVRQKESTDAKRRSAQRRLDCCDLANSSCSMRGRLRCRCWSICRPTWP